MEKTCINKNAWKYKVFNAKYTNVGNKHIQDIWLINMYKSAYDAVSYF